MPWEARDAKKHNKKAVGRKGKIWAETANKVLAQTGDEGRAARIANYVISGARKKR